MMKKEKEVVHHLFHEEKAAEAHPQRRPPSKLMEISGEQLLPSITLSVVQKVRGHYIHSQQCISF